MSLTEYIEFWMASWDYMKGSRWDFWVGLPRATLTYRKDVIKAKKDGKW